MQYDPLTRMHYLGDDEYLMIVQREKEMRALNRDIVYAFLACMENDSSISEGGLVLDHDRILSIIERIEHPKLSVCWCSKCKGGTHV